MKMVTREEIIETWDRLCALDEKQSATLSKKFLEAQPALGVYLLASTEDLGEEAAESPLVELVLAVWEVMTRVAGAPLKNLAPETIEAAEEANISALQNLESASEFQWHDAASGLIGSFNQREILGFCIEVLMADDEEQPELAPERIGMEMIVLKTVIDCLDQ